MSEDSFTVRREVPICALRLPGERLAQYMAQRLVLAVESEILQLSLVEKLTEDFIAMSWHTFRAPTN